MEAETGPSSSTDTEKILFIEVNPHLTEEDKNAGSSSKNRKKAENEGLHQKDLDPNCIIHIDKRLVRVEYPGEVLNIEKAIETLGGMDSIESSVADHSRKLELYFHPRNKYNKSCIADKDFKPGILIKVKKPPIRMDSVYNLEDDKLKYDYSVEGVSVINFNFNRLCDFQYLPLISKQLETNSTKTENIYEKILPSQLPTSNWLESEESKNMELFLLPGRFSFYDSAHSKVTVDKNEKNEPKLKLKGIENSSDKMNSRQRKSVCRIFRKARQQNSIFVGFNDQEIPTQPLESAVKLLKYRHLENQIGRVKQLFEERPIWTKAAVRHITGLSDEHSKVVLPVVAYHFTNGPWRITWVKFGYDPRKDTKARIYQILDYRIRTADSTKMKVTAKRNYAGKTSLFLGPGQMKKVSLKNDMSAKPKMELDERFYVLRPLIIPPARQMFYQFCDLLLPEIQDLISRLPEHIGSFCHPKHGFFPDNFIDQSREIVNRHVLDAVQKELLEDKKMLKEKVSKPKESKASGSNLDYYNQMLNNIKKGIYKNVGLQFSQVPRDVSQEDVELISLSSDEENEYTVGDIIQSSIPEKLDGGEDDEHSDVSELSDEAEIDMEAVQEINEIISQLNEKL